MLPWCWKRGGELNCATGGVDLHVRTYSQENSQTTFSIIRVQL